jgi:carboxypeptidase C (cathepsin A)
LPQQPGDLEPFLQEVEQFALGEYAQALMQGSRLDDARKQAVAEKLHQYTGLSVSYLMKANLRVTGGMFEHELQSDTDDTTGRLDTRFAGPSLDPLSKEAEYDPQSSAISSAYIAAFNDYVRKDLKFGQDLNYREFADVKEWIFKHNDHDGAVNVMPDSGDGDEDQPQSQGVPQRRLLRFRHAVLCGGLRNAPHPCAAAADEQRELCVVSVRPHGVRA